MTSFRAFSQRVFHFFFAAKKETKQRKNPCRKDASTLLGTNAENSVKVSDLCYRQYYSFAISDFSNNYLLPSNSFKANIKRQAPLTNFHAFLPNPSLGPPFRLPHAAASPDY